jgi:hypothetical protein
MPVPPWEEDEGPGEPTPITSDAPAVQEVMMRFGLTFPTAGGAEAFVRFFGFAGHEERADGSRQRRLAELLVRRDR